MTCVAYLCQQHHDLELSSEKIVENVLAGTYVLHEFAAMNWLQLVKRSFCLVSRGTLPSDLIGLLETCLSDRSNYQYDGKSKNGMRVELAALKDARPELYDLLSRALQFSEDCSASQYARQEGMY